METQLTGRGFAFAALESFASGVAEEFNIRFEGIRKEENVADSIVIMSDGFGGLIEIEAEEFCESVVAARLASSTSRGDVLRARLGIASTEAQ